MKKPKKIAPPKAPEPVAVTYKYAFNTKEEVGVLTKFYTQKIAVLASADNMNNSDLIIKYVDRIKFLENQFTAPASPKY